MKARAQFLGHPVHQMLIVLPLGLLSGVIIFDLLHLLFQNAQWVAVAYWLIPAGIITGLLAAVFGLIDWTKIDAGSRARRVGIYHAVGNVIVLILFALSWWLREPPPVAPDMPALILSFAGGALSMVSGWLGGELVNRLGIGVHPGANIDAPSSLKGS